MTDPQDQNIEIKGEHLYSARFDDHYASRHQPQAEKFAVFCEGNHLPERFPKAKRFTIGELGFGSGLGFLVTAKLWLETAPEAATLDFISIEGFPLTRPQLALAQQAFPDLAHIAEALQAAYPGDNSGFHRLNLFDDRIRLTLVIGDVLDGLNQLEAQVDAWYLDGFAPAKNPEMWRPDIFRAMNRLSADEATFATYTAAGQVRRDLQAARFAVEKVPGYAQKRERLVGRLQERLPPQQKPKPWRQRPSAPQDLKALSILGGGIAGCALANRLAARGINVTIVEAENQLAGAASSNPVAIGHPHFTRDQNLTSQLALQGFLYTLQSIGRLETKGLNTGFRGNGMVVLPKSEKDRDRQEQIVAGNPPSPSLAQWQGETQLTQAAGIPIQNEGWHLPESGWVSLPRLCHALVSEQNDRITLETGKAVSDIRHEDGVWELLDAEGNAVHRCRHLVLANGYAMRDFGPVAHLPLRANRGQVNYASAPQHGVTPVLCAKGYTVPLDEDHLCFGSSYAPGESEARIDPENHASNIEQLRAAFPELADCLENEDGLDWSGVRTVLPDRFPLLGAVAKPEAFIDTFSPMFRGEIQHQNVELPLFPSLYVYTGLGSRSVAYSLIGAEMLASELTGGASPMPAAVRDAVDVNRFLLRKSGKK